MVEDTELKAKIQELEEALLKPEVRVDIGKLDELLHDEFFEHGSSGVVFYKKDCMGEGGVGVREMRLFDFELHFLGEDALLATYVCVDKTRGHQSIRSSIWKFADGRWQMFFHQGTLKKS
nr:DUF4440 domain-containing protein [Alteribacter aurantiacus]